MKGRGYRLFCRSPPTPIEFGSLVENFYYLLLITQNLAYNVKDPDDSLGWLRHWAYADVGALHIEHRPNLLGAHHRALPAQALLVWSHELTLSF